MSGYITFYSEDYGTIQIKPPIWGYSTEIHMALNMEKNPFTGEPNSWDNGSSHDYRLCSMSFSIQKQSKTEIASFLHSVLAGRNREFELGTLYTTGFFPFGADKPAEFLYNVLEMNNKSSSRLHRPYNHYKFEISLMLLNCLASSTPSIGANQDTLQIGTVTGLPFPQSKPEYKKGWDTTITAGGKPNSLSLGKYGSYYETELTLDLNRGNMSALILYLLSIRNGIIPITTPSNSSIFGAENGDGLFNCKLNSPILKIMHTGVDHFMITIPLWMKEKIV